MLVILGNKRKKNSTRVSHYHEIVQIVNLAIRTLYVAGFNAGLISEYLIPGSRVIGGTPCTAMVYAQTFSRTLHSS